MNETISILKKKSTLIALGVGFAICLTLAYSSHFTNGFHFDDAHTIVHNEYIQDISNIPLFFTELETFGTMPNNRTYRPVITMLNTIDYWMGGGLDPVYFHISIFLSYLVLGLFIYLITVKIFDASFDSGYNPLIALGCTVFYMFHTANAETINYIIMRSDSFSTLCMILGLWFYMNEKTRKYQLHLLMILVGIASKESALMMVPLLFLYILFFEQDASLPDVLKFKKPGALFRTLRLSLPAIAVGIIFFWFTRVHFRPEASLFAEPYYGPFQYFYTQWVVMTHYIGNFFFPIDLSADPDFAIIPSLWTPRVIFSGLFLAALVVLAYRTSVIKKYRPIAFGILWFFICLAPTSTIIPFGQISNDHRTFNAYIGLCMALGWWIGLLIVANLDKIKANPSAKYLLLLAGVAILGGHAYGIRQRSDVWSSEDKLWKDVAEKSPNNGRGLMNYGLTLMAKGQYEETMVYFQKALEILPNYSFLHINLGILTNAMGDSKKAEEYYLRSIQLDPSNAEAYYYYSKFLRSQGRLAEALENARRGLELSPGHATMKIYYEDLKNQPPPKPKPPEGDPVAQLAYDGNDIYFINLSLSFYRQGLFPECVQACKKALELNPESKEAYNNLCIAYIRLSKYREAVEAGEKAVALDPNFTLARNNLQWARSLIGH